MINETIVRNRDPRQLLWVCYGLGVDSTAILIEFARRGIRPDVITFADTGSEKDATYRYLPVINEWLRSVGFPEVTVVKKDTKLDQSLGDSCLRLHTLPSIAFNLKGCSQKWKKQVQEAYANKLPSAQACWKAGYKIIKVIGYDNGDKDARRAHIPDDAKYTYWYSLQDFNWDRDRCIAEIARAGLPGWNPDNERPDARLYWVEKGGVPVKSACYFCSVSKPWEIDRLARTEPHNFEKALLIEHKAVPYLGPNIKGLGGRERNWKHYSVVRGLPMPRLPRRFPLVVVNQVELFDNEPNGKGDPMAVPRWEGWREYKRKTRVHLFKGYKRRISLKQLDEAEICGA